MCPTRDNSHNHPFLSVWTAHSYANSHLCLPVKPSTAERKTHKTYMPIRLNSSLKAVERLKNIKWKYKYKIYIYQYKIINKTYKIYIYSQMSWKLYIQPGFLHKPSHICLKKKKKTLHGPPSLKNLTNFSQKEAVVSTAILMENLVVNSGLALV